MEQQANNSTKRIIYITFGLAATGVLGYLGWNYYQKSKNQPTEETDFSTDTKDNLMPPPTSSYASSTPNNSNDFPLHKGSKGERVKSLQQYLIQKYGAKILPNYGADGDWGTEMDNALKNVKLPTLIDESTYNLLVKGTSPNSNVLVQSFIKAVISKNFVQVINNLKQLRNTDDYAKISSQFKLYRINGVHQTLVNGLLSAFTSEEQKQQIRMEFLRMGLKYDGNKWALNGWETRMIITTVPTWVIVNQQEKVAVPAHVVLGKEWETRNGITLFENNQQLFAVDASQVRFL